MIRKYLLEQNATSVF
ncbi:hypothetical protein MED222_05890 [Vibrio sp. MED222]|nr:hypothetical protein MED222_05890 [Vibrio sp. MED222]